MEKILFVGDSACCLRPEDIQGKSIRVLPVTVCWGGREARECYDLMPESYCKILRDNKEVPVTQQVTPQQYLDLYYEAIAQGYTHIIAVTISSTASGSAASAVTARELLSSDLGGIMPVIEVVDSRGYSMMFGRLLLEGEVLAASGTSFAEIKDYIQDKVSRSEAILMVYTLAHMKKSGRISGMSAFVGEALGMRPILRACDGMILPIDKARGEKNVVPRMIELLKNYVAEPEKQVFYLIYCDLPAAEIDKAEQTLRDVFHPLDVLRHPIGPSVATNTGPDCLAVVYYGQKRTP